MTDIEYRQIPHDFPVEQLFQFVMGEGKTPFNWLIEEDVRRHFEKLKTGTVSVWGAFTGDMLAGIISASNISQFNDDDNNSKAAEICEFVVSSKVRSKGVGKKLVRLAMDGVFENWPTFTDLYVMTHSENTISQRAFLRGGFDFVLTFDDRHRSRITSVLKFQKPRPIRVLGIQSGNAVDGIDVVIVDISQSPILGDSPKISYDVKAFHTYPWASKMRDRIFAAREGMISLRDVNMLNYELSHHFAAAAEKLIGTSNIQKDSIDLVSSHGQTIDGHPHWELGEPSTLAQLLSITTIGDFRPADVGAGGNGSPCTCTYDQLMLLPAEGCTDARICINIGGTSSVTFCPTPGSGQSVTGLDPGLGVLYIDWATKLYDNSLDYDDNGDLARGGQIDEELVQTMLQHPHFLKECLPISVGPDDFSRRQFEQWVALAQARNISKIDIISTMTELSARSIAQACKRFGPRTNDIIVRGGVCNNAYFMERLRINLEACLELPIERLKTLTELGLDEESWETVLYALLGYLCFTKQTNFIPSCTGANHAVIGGKICQIEREP